jgi:hypothetical protein
MKVKIYVIEYTLLEWSEALEDEIIIKNKYEAFPTIREAKSFAKEKRDNGYRTRFYDLNVSNTKRGFIGMFNHFQAKTIDPNRQPE